MGSILIVFIYFSNFLDTVQTFGFRSPHSKTWGAKIIVRTDCSKFFLSDFQIVVNVLFSQHSYTEYPFNSIDESQWGKTAMCQSYLRAVLSWNASYMGCQLCSTDWKFSTGLEWHIESVIIILEIGGRKKTTRLFLDSSDFQATRYNYCRFLFNNCTVHRVEAVQVL